MLPIQRWFDCFQQKNLGDCVKVFYLSQLTDENANRSDDLANNLDLTFIIESNSQLNNKIYDKRDDFDFYIVNFPFLSSNIPSSPSYGVYIPQLIRYARCCAHVMMTLDVAICFWLTDSYLRAMKWNTRETDSKNFMANHTPLCVYY